MKTETTGFYITIRDTAEDSKFWYNHLEDATSFLVDCIRNGWGVRIEAVEDIGVNLQELPEAVRWELAYRDRANAGRGEFAVLRQYRGDIYALFGETCIPCKMRVGLGEGDFIRAIWRTDYATAREYNPQDENDFARLLLNCVEVA